MSNFVTPNDGGTPSRKTIQTGSAGSASQTGSDCQPIQTGSGGEPIQTGSDGRASRALPWMEWEVGERVVVRYRKPDGLYDALGHLTEVAADHVTVNTRKGLVTVPANLMVTGKRVPESPFGA